MPTIVVVGLGPGGAGLVLPDARALIEHIACRWVRTTRHPAVADLEDEGLTFRSFDDRYESAADLDEVYRGIADALVEQAREHGEVVYAVPGNPAVAERSVREVCDRASAAGVGVRVVPGLSFVDLAWARLGVDPMSGARVLDAHDLDLDALESGGPILLAQVDDRFVASDVKLALLEHADPATPVTVLQRLGGPGERVAVVALADLDREVEPDHLTACFVDLPPGPAARFGALVVLARRLRGPDGCPWDAEQTHHTLTRYVVEEAYEVVDAIAALPADDAPEAGGEEVWAAFADELGDLLFQVVLHSVLAQEAGHFDAAEVVAGIHEKLVRRHPHVFGDVEVADGDDVVRNWEQIKRDERGSESLVDSVPASLPALLLTHKLFRKAASIGLDPASPELTRVALDDAAGVLDDPAAVVDDRLVGEMLAAAVALARRGGVDAEAALRAWAARYRARFQRMEAGARASGTAVHDLAPDAVAELWAAAAAD